MGSFFMGRCFQKIKITCLVLRAASSHFNYEVDAVLSPANHRMAWAISARYE